jgi:thiol-disulfide isomerase/thioredoxin
MIGMRRHPSESSFGRYLAGRVDDAERRELEQHLAECNDCRDLAQLETSLLKELTSNDAPALPSSLRDRVLTLARDPGVPKAQRSRFVGLVVTAAAVIVAAIVLLGRTRPATAGPLIGDLRFTPADPFPGATIDIRYAPSERFRSAKQLVLRARLRSASDLPGPNQQSTVVARLARQSDGSYRGTMRLPDSVVYASFAVEDSGARHVDSNGHQLWELVMHGADGRPLYDALEQRHDELSPRDWTEAFATARRATELYPARARAWYIRSFFESAVLPRESQDSLRAVQRLRLAALDRALSRSSSVDPDDIGAMWMYAASLGDSVLTARWSARLEAEAPRTLWGVQLRFGRILRSKRSPAEKLASLDSLWSELGTAMTVFTAPGVQLASSLGDAAAVQRWVSRALETRTIDSLYAASVLARFPSDRDDGLRRLREQVASLRHVNDSYRPLDQDSHQEQLARRDRLRMALAQLGDVLLQAGETRSALDTLVLATTIGWDAGLFVRVARAERDVGDIRGAVLLLARAAADPAAPPGLRDTARAWTQGQLSDSTWRFELAGGRRTMTDRILDGAIDRALPDHVRLTTLDGRETDLHTAAAGRPTVVAFWSRYCAPSAQQLPALALLAKRLDSLGVSLVSVTSEPPSTDLRAYLVQRHLEIPVFVDTHREARLAFHQFATPQLYVLDGRGRLRFELSGVQDVITQAAVLLEEKEK